eukprot:comp21786_c0_seq1/m.30950 comp21786_c0_seq1/g.30950  ORF comp21786_c0_seq1/g.30950 comp21786_c0_seq1/m.30950 type:complete len:357 (-) comp21786_c0_seq1:402-1472(-)
MASTYVIVGDCGGTNTRLALWEIPQGAKKPKRGECAPGTLKFDKKYLNEQHFDFVSVMKLFVEEAMKEAGITERPKVACLACAGPILDNTVNFTNIASGWFIDGKRLEKDLNIARVLLVNDFTAMGYGLLTLRNDECAVLNDVPPVEGGVVATIGAGTGLGECFLSKDPAAEDYVCWATEGGHTDFAPRDDLEYELLGYMRKRFAQKHRVSVERVISGPGIATIYDFLSNRHPDKVNKELDLQIQAAGSLKGGEVAKNSENDELCRQAMEIFFTAYASECGNAMLKWLPNGGFYITGGIAAKNLSWIVENKKFVETMFDKGRVSPAIKACPIYVAKVDDVGERGAHLVAFNLLSKL